MSETWPAKLADAPAKVSVVAYIYASLSESNSPLPAGGSQLGFQPFTSAALEERESRSFFMVLGGPRSGTTLLAQCLSANSQILVPYESDIIAPCALIVDRVKDAESGKPMIANLIIHSYYFDVSVGKYLTPDEVRQVVASSRYEVGEIFANLYSLIGARAGKRIVGDKSPFDLFNAYILHRTGLLNSPTKLIHIVRDIRDVMVSLNRQDWFPNADVYFPRLWSERNLFIQAQLQGAPNYFFLRYEDFVSRPEGLLDSLCRFLGAEFEESMLDTESFSSFYRAIPAHNHLHDPIGTSHVGQWKHQATNEQVRMYEVQAREALLKFGYLD